MWQAPLHRRLTETVHLRTRTLSGMYNDTKHMVRLSRPSMGEGDSHSKDAGKVTSASDVSGLPPRSSILRGSISHVNVWQAPLHRRMTQTVH